MSRDSTAIALIKAGRALIYEGGFNQTGIQTILAGVGVPKGSFYYYFPSKEAFGRAVIDDFVEEHRAIFQRFYLELSGTPLTRLRLYFQHYIELFEAQEFRGGCFIGNLSQELADQNENLRRRLADAFSAWQSATADCLRQAANIGELVTRAAPEPLAEFCLSAWQGAILRMKVSRSRDPLDAFVTMFFDGLLTTSTVE